MWFLLIELCEIELKTSSVVSRCWDLFAVSLVLWVCQTQGSVVKAEQNPSSKCSMAGLKLVKEFYQSISKLTTYPEHFMAKKFHLYSVKSQPPFQTQPRHWQIPHPLARASHHGHHGGISTWHFRRPCLPAEHGAAVPPRRSSRRPGRVTQCTGDRFPARNDNFLKVASAWLVESKMQKSSATILKKSKIKCHVIKFTTLLVPSFIFLS